MIPTTITNTARIILYVDDDEDDRLMVSETISEVDTRIEVVQASNGREAIQYLSNAKVGNTLLPCLVILDINMPVLDGKQTLIVLKKDEELKHVPVVLFSTSNSPIDKLFCDVHGVELVTKPSDIKNIKSEVQKLLRYCAQG
jgi:CheY-like chemotaxis protein